MSESLGSAVLELSTSDAGFDRGMDRAEGRARKSAKTMSNLGKTMGLGLAAGFGIAVIGGADELKEIEQVGAQTTAVIRSTGGAAGVSQGQIEGLAGQLQELSGMDDQAIQSGQNLLLTFTKVQNRAGEGNDIFNQASSAMVNYAVAMKTDARGAALQLGKALQDPTRGVTKLARAGVQFTDQQKAQIKAMQESGDMAGAQKIILKELETQFGGSAAAAGQLASSKLAVLTDQLKGMAAGVLGFALPAVFKLVAAGRELAAWVQSSIGPWMEQHRVVERVGAVIETAKAAIDGFMFALTGQSAGLSQSSAAVVGFAVKFQQVVSGIKVGAKLIGAAIGAVVRFLVSRILPMWKGVFGDYIRTVQVVAQRISQLWNAHGAGFISLVQAQWDRIKAVIEPAMKALTSIVRAVMAVIRGDWSEAWEHIKNAVVAILRTIVALVKGIGGVLMGAAKFSFKMLVKGAVAAVKAAPGAVVAILKGIGRLLKGVGSFLMDKAGSIGSDIVSGVVSGIRKGAGKIKDAMVQIAKDALKSAMKILDIRSPSQVFAEQVGFPIAQGMALGISRGTEGMVSAATSAVEQARAAAAAASQQRQNQQQDDAANATVQASQSKVNAAQTALTRAQGIRNRQRRMAAVAAARTALAAARAELNGAIADRRNMLSERAWQAQNEAAVEQAEAAANAIQAQQDNLSSGLSAIGENAALREATMALQLALNGGRQTEASIAGSLESAKQQYLELQGFLQQNVGTMTVAMRTDVLGEMASVLDGVRELENDLADLRGVGTAAVSSVSSSLGGNAAAGAGAVTRLPGGVAGDAGGSFAPLVGTINMTDPDVDVPHLIRRVNWAARQVGAY